MIRLTVFLISGSFLLGAASSTLAGSYEDSITKLLDEGWEDSFRALKPAEEHFEQARQANPIDIKARYAYALVQLKHRRYRNAQELLEEVLKQQPSHLQAREGMVWVEMLTKKYTAALAQMDLLAKLVAEQRDQKPHETLASAAMMGRMTGYLMGPALRSLRGVDIEAYREKLLAELSSDEQRAFEESRRDVELQFAELTLDEEQARAEAEVAAEKDRERQKEQLAGQKDAVEDAKEDIDALASKMRQEAEGIISDCDRQLDPLNRRFAQLAAEGQRVSAQMNSLNSEINRLNARANSTDDPALQSSYRAQADRLRFDHARYSEQYRLLDVEARQVNAQRLALENRKQAVANQFNAEMKRLGREAVTIVRTEKRIMQDERKLDKPGTGSTARTRTIAAQAAALTTYYQFPLEREKQRVLESLDQ